MNRLENHYKKLVNRDLFSKLGYQKELKINKIVLHISLRDKTKTITKDTKLLKAKVFKALIGLELLTGAKPKINFCKKAIGEIQLRKGSLASISVSLEKAQLYFFLDQLINQNLPNLRPFENLKKEGIDSEGNFNFRLKSMLSFPSLQQNYQKFLSENQEEESLDLSITSSSKKREESLLLYSAFQIPFEGFSKGL